MWNPERVQGENDPYQSNNTVYSSSYVAALSERDTYWCVGQSRDFLLGTNANVAGTFVLRPSYLDLLRTGIIIISLSINSAKQA